MSCRNQASCHLSPLFQVPGFPSPSASPIKGYPLPLSQKLKPVMHRELVRGAGQALPTHLPHCNLQPQFQIMAGIPPEDGRLEDKPSTMQEFLMGNHGPELPHPWVEPCLNTGSTKRGLFIWGSEEALPAGLCLA